MNFVCLKDCSSIDELFTFFLGELTDHEKILLIGNMSEFDFLHT